MTSDLSSARTSATGRQPDDIRVSNRYPRPRTYTRRPFDLCHEGRYEVVQQVVVWFDCFDFNRLQGYLSCVFKRLSLVCFYCLCFLFFLSIATMSFAGYFLVRSLLPAFSAYLRTFFRLDFCLVRLSCDHGWIRSGSVNVR